MEAETKGARNNGLKMDQYTVHGITWDQVWLFAFSPRLTASEPSRARRSDKFRRFACLLVFVLTPDLV